MKFSDCGASTLSLLRFSFALPSSESCYFNPWHLQSSSAWRTCRQLRFPHSCQCALYAMKAPASSWYWQSRFGIVRWHHHGWVGECSPVIGRYCEIRGDEFSRRSFFVSIPIFRDQGDAKSSLIMVVRKEKPQKNWTSHKCGHSPCTWGGGASIYSYIPFNLGNPVHCRFVYPPLLTTYYFT